jgi:hypothetical protein
MATIEVRDRSLEWMSLRIVDDVNLSSDNGPAIEAIRAQLPKLTASLESALREDYQVLAPAPPGTPGDDGFGDHIEFQRALLRTGAAAHRQRLEESRAKVAELELSDNLKPSVAGWVLIDSHQFLSDLGLITRAARAKSYPPSGIGSLRLAEVLWDARNQDQL